MMKRKANWVMGFPFRVDHYCQFALALEESKRLRMSYLWHRAGYPGIPAENARLLPILGSLVCFTAHYTPTDFAENLRFRLHPFYDNWMAKQIKPGDIIYSSYAYANASFRRAKQMDGLTLIDGGNSHPQNYWDILSEEHIRWGVREDPILRYHHERSVEMIEHTDFVVSPSTYVTHSFLERGFSKERILKSFYPVNLSLFKPSELPRPANRPFTIVNASGLSLRKGSPYLFESFRRIHKEIPNVRFLVTRSGNLPPVILRLIAEYSDLPIEWCGYLSHQEMADRFRQADLLILPSLEDGFARVVTEAMSCGLPVIISENTGAADLVESGVNGSVVPIRAVDAMVSSALEWWERIRSGYHPPVSTMHQLLTPESYRARVLEIAEEVDAISLT